MKLNNNAAECLSIDIKFILGFVEFGQPFSKSDMGKTHSEHGELTRHSFPFKKKSSLMKMILQSDKIRF